MTGYRLSPNVYAQLEDIYLHTSDKWGEAQADEYVHGVFELFESLATGAAHSRRLPKETGVDGRVTRYRSHFVIWREGPDGEVLVAAILHQRMNINARLRDIAPADELK